MNAMWRPALFLFVALTAITGLLYPALVTLIGRVAFPAQASGSLIVDQNRLLGSALIGQSFSDPGYFWGRPSATAPQPYNGAASSGSNLGPLNPALADAVKTRIAALRALDPENTAPIPVDLVTASASGLDPHISPAAALFQAARVARARGLKLDAVQDAIARHTQGRQWGLFGEPRVNVLELNRALDLMSQEVSGK